MIATPTSSIELAIADESTLAQVAARVYAALEGGEYIALRGPLGAGKTSFARAMLRAGGYTGAVRSPTFTLLEPYVLSRFTVLHMDLYRIADPSELEMLGVRERFGDSVCLVEWPERAESWLPRADLQVELDFVARSAVTARVLRLTAHGARGETVLAAVCSGLRESASLPTG